MSSKQKIDEIDVQYVKGVGEVRAKHLKKSGINTVSDLINYFPRRYLDRSEILPINQVRTGEDTTVLGRIIRKEFVFRPRKRLIVTIHDGSGQLDGVWFNQADFFSKIFKKDQEVAFSGKIGFFRGWQIVHPEYDIIDDSGDQLHTGQIIPLYPGTQYLRRNGITSRSFRRFIHYALVRYGDRIEENLPEYLISRYRLLERPTAYQLVHFPDQMEHLDQPARRFKYEELFYIQLMMALRHHYHRSPVQGIKMQTSGATIRKVLQQLPFELTNSQRKVLNEIYADLKSGKPMNRLLQGDVGSGKTLVALITALIAAENGFQTALMAPTEILAEQHFMNIKQILSGTPFRVEHLTGSMKNQEKQQIHDALKGGDIRLVIGTHALVQETVEFQKLGLVIIDEQHRFGVLQRGELVGKGWNPHVLVMTATPIPRTLALTLYGDLDTSVIDEMPPGRQPITTVWRTDKKTTEIHKFIRDNIEKGGQAYIIYPLVEESEKMDLKAATESYRHLQKKVFPEIKIALMHGRLKSSEKEQTMQKFKSGEVKILVSTTVVEVGMDVPNATILLIEHAERFGLSQLHQLRGRVGRSPKKSYCILLTPEKISGLARERMELMENTTDGFRIAEEDLRLRGSGEFFGTKQHGLPDLNFADLIADRKIIEVAREDAFKLVEDDPQLRKADHRRLREYFQKYYIEKYKLIRIS